MMLESIEKLREVAGRNYQYTVWQHDFETAIAELEREISERYLLLPVDADGMPIRVGMSVYDPYGKQLIVDRLYLASNIWRIEGRGGEISWLASSCRVKRTVKDVLAEYRKALDVNCGLPIDRVDEIDEEYAAILNNLLGGEK